MKGVFIFNHRNDIVFIHNDKSFEKYLIDVATKDGLVEEGQDTEKELDPNIILQLYSPLVASQRFMIGQAKNPYNYIKSANGFAVILKQFSDYVFVAVNGDGEETENFMHRKLLVLKQIISFLHGPCIEEIRPDKHRERVVRWKLIGRCLQTWCDLYNKEQSFLVEAVERLHVNQILNSASIELLEKALTRIRLAGEKHATHAMLIVRSKLLSHYSVRNATVLGSADQLMLILLANMLYGEESSREDIGDISSLSPRQTLTRTPSASGPVQIRAGQTPSAASGGSSSELDMAPSHSTSETGPDSDEKQASFVSKTLIDSFAFSDTSLSGGQQTPVRSVSYSNDPFSQSLTLDRTSVYSDTGGVATNGGSTDDIFYSSTRSSDARATTGELIAPELPKAKLSSHIFGYMGRSQSMSFPVSSQNTTGDSQRSQTIRHSSSGNLVSNSDALIVENQQRLTKNRPNSLGIHTINEVTANTKQTTTPRKSNSMADFIQIALPRQGSFKDFMDESVQALNIIPNSFHQSTFNAKPDSRKLHTPNNNTIPTFQITEAEPLLGTGGEGLETQSAPSSQSENSNSSNPSDGMEYPNLTVMLSKGEVENVPHVVHCVHVMRGIYLIIVCERPNVQYAQVINQASHNLNAILALKASKSKHTPKQIQEHLDNSIRKLGELLKKSKGLAHIERLILDSCKKWETAKQLDFLAHYYLALTAHKPFPPRLESSLCSLLEKLHELFRHLYLSKRYMAPEEFIALRDCINEVHISVYRGLLDYKDYIAIKAQRNVAMTTYMNEFPGMVHFLFMNRTCSHVIAASFNEHAQSDESEQGVQRLIKRKVWQHYERMRQKLAAGFTSVTSREGGFHYSFFLWFEDTQGGFTVAPHKEYTGLRAQDNLLPGILSSFNFYSWLQRSAFPRSPERRALQCYELFVMHVALVSTELALSQTRKLAARLWDSGGGEGRSVRATENRIRI